MGLERFRVDAPADPVTIQPFQPAVKPFHRYIGFDPSLAKTGWVMGFVDGEGKLVVEGSGIIKTTSSLTSHEKTFDCARQIWDALSDLPLQTAFSMAHEMPPVGSFGGKNRPDSALSASLTIRLFWSVKFPGQSTSSVSAQKVKGRWTGDPKADKPTLAKCLRAVHPEILDQMKVNNQDTRDALGVLLFAMEGRS